MLNSVRKATDFGVEVESFCEEIYLAVDGINYLPDWSYAELSICGDFEARIC